MMLVLVCCLLVLGSTQAFGTPSLSLSVPRALARGTTSMEYIPDGLSKAQWEKMKADEVKRLDGKDLSAVGITKFKSRSFEAWQKAGQKHLFPVDAATPVNEKPYMQRLGGSWDAKDIKGGQAKGQAAPQKFTDVDAKYAPQPASKKPAEVPKKPAAKEVVKAAAAVTPAEPKKKLFGLF